MVSYKLIKKFLINVDNELFCRIVRISLFQNILCTNLELDTRLLIFFLLTIFFSVLNHFFKASDLAILQLYLDFLLNLQLKFNLL